jgi:hypothetical protein
MDTKNHLCTKDKKSLINHFKRAWKLMKLMQEKLEMAYFWCCHLHHYFVVLKRVTRQWADVSGASPDSNSSGSTEVRPYGLEEWVLIENDLKQFGNNAENQVSNGENKEIDFADDGSESGSHGVVKSDDGDTLQGTPQSDSLPPPSSFTTINKNQSPLNIDNEKNTYGPARRNTNDFGDVYPAVRSTDYTGYGMASYPSTSGGSHLPCSTLQPTESAQRHSLLAPQVYSQIPASIMYHYSQPPSLQTPEDFRTFYEGVYISNQIPFENFAGGNENANDEVMMSYPLDLYNPTNYQHQRYNSNT